MIQHLARHVEAHILRQHQRQLSLRQRNHPAGRAMHNRDRRPPIALPAEPPVPQTPIHHPLASAAPLQLGNRRPLGLARRRQPVQEARIDHHPVLDEGLRPNLERRRIRTRRQHHRRHRQSIFAREIQITLVMRRTAKNRPRAVFHQHEIGDPHRKTDALDKRMRHPQPGVVAALLRRLDHRLARPQAGTLGHKRRRRRITGRHRRRQWMLRRNRHERHAKQRVRPRGINLHCVDPGLGRYQSELQPRPFAAPDPVRLHQPHPLGPVLHPVQRAQQLRRIRGNPIEPLRQALLLHRSTRAPAPPVDHLLVGQHGAVHRIPIHQALAAIHQPRLEKIQEQLLLVAVIAGIAGRELAAPIDRQPHALQLRAHRRNILPRPLARMHPTIARRILRRQAKSVPPHRVQHRKTACPLVPRHHIAQRVVAHMAHVDLPAGIRKHLKHIVFRLAVGRHVLHPKTAARMPRRLPLRLRRPKIVARPFGQHRTIAHSPTRSVACSSLPCGSMEGKARALPWTRLGTGARFRATPGGPRPLYLRQ